MRKSTKRSQRIKPAGTAGDPSATVLRRLAKADSEDAKQLLENRSWPTRPATNVERAAYKLGQLAGMDAALGGTQALEGISGGLLTDRDALIVLEDLLLKGQLTPEAAQAIVQKLVSLSSVRPAAVE